MDTDPLSYAAEMQRERSGKWNTAGSGSRGAISGNPLWGYALQDLGS